MTPEAFLQFADVLPEATLLVGGDGLILAANRATQERLGVLPTALRGRPLAEVVAEPPAAVARYLRNCCRSRALVLGALTLTLAGPLACRVEGALLQPATEADPARVLLRLMPKESAIGKFVALSEQIEELNREIGRRRQAEERTREEEQRLRVTLASIGDAVVVTDAAGRVSSLNAVAEGLTGWNTADAVGRPLPEVFVIVNETTREPVEDPVAKVLERGVVVGLANHTVLLARDGSERPIADSAAPIKDEAGRILGVVLVFRDMTEERAAERALREREEQARREAEANAKFRVFFEQGANFAGVLALDGTVVEANHLSLVACGFTRDEVIGKPFWECGWWNPSAELAERVRSACLQAAAGRLFRGESIYFVADGSERMVDLILAPVMDDAGRVLFVAATGTDITERKGMENTLRDADRKKDEFIALLAHELRNPLAPLRNGLQVLRLADADASTAAAQARAMMERQLAHLVRLIEDLLDVSRIGRHKMVLQRQRVALADVVASAVETARPPIESAGHELTVTLPAGPVHLDADPMRLAQVLSNLLTNSAKYTPPGGRIWLTAETADSEVIVAVRDTGIGIPADYLPTIFDMFSQVDRSVERSTGGLGIGLALVKGLVEMHGGTVAAESPGRGSTFTVRLPTLAVLPEAPTEVAAEAVAAVAARRVLVVDDNRDGAESLAMMLRLLGHEVETAHDGLEGFERAEAFRPDVILMDVGMPRLNGLDATRRIRAQPWGRAVVILALTGWGQEGDRERSREAGCDGHLVKPVSLPDLERLLGEPGGS